MDERELYPPSQPIATSEDAARRVALVVQTRREEVWEYIASWGHTGCTDNQIIEAMAARGHNRNGPRARRVELKKAGRVYAVGVRDGSTVWAIYAKPEGLF